MIFKGELASRQQNSTNSSKPPSSDGPEVVRKKAAPKGKKHGGQTGHTGKCRELLPVEEMDHVHDLWATSCEKCRLPLGPHKAKETCQS
jgi:transposase